MPSERVYLSIGEVLSLLKEDFPDVTISKIRFLESQGLLDPERTPSGYRKFYEADIERLRWILRQQRENFLPLKVIRGRLGSEAAGAQGDPDLEGSEVEAEAAGNGREEAAAVGARASGDARGAKAGREQGEEVGVGARRAHGAAAFLGQASTAGSGAAGAPAGGGSGGTGASRADPAATGPDAAPDAAPDRAPRPASQGSGRRRVAGGSPGTGESLLSAGLTGVNLTLEELCGVSGLRPDQVRELERYGLLTGRAVAGTSYYDEEASVVASLASEFLRFGVEARHLRMYKTAAEREAGFFEQVVMPLLKQRNPDARRQAAHTLSELSRLGAGLRTAMLRVALRDHTGG